MVSRLNGLAVLVSVSFFRVSMLQEQLLFAMPYSTYSSFVLPIDLQFLNPISAMDVLGGVHNIMAGKTNVPCHAHSLDRKPNRSKCPCWSHMLAHHHSRCGQLFATTPVGMLEDRYWDWKGRVPCRRLSDLLPWWPGDAEAALMREYFEHVNRCVGPTKETPDWDATCPRVRRRPSVMLDAVKESTKEENPSRGKVTLCFSFIFFPIFPILPMSFCSPKKRR